MRSQVDRSPEQGVRSRWSALPLWTGALCTLLGARAGAAQSRPVEATIEAHEPEIPVAAETKGPHRFVAWFRGRPRQPGESQSIGEPGPDLANYPNSAWTLSQWAFYLESTPLNLASATDVTPFSYNWELFLRLGLTDNIELRVYSGGLGVYAGSHPTALGFFPLTFDTKLHLLERTWKYFNFSLGLEVYVQTPWGSSDFANGLQYSASLLADHALPWELSYEWNLGFVRVPIPSSDDQVFVPTFQAALQRPIVGDLAIFLQSYRNAATLPRTGLSKVPLSGKERGGAFGMGLQWLLGDRWAVFGSFDVGYGALAPLLSGNLGLAVCR
jgi:hypothetical protein